MAEDPTSAVRGFDPVGLEELDRRASLQERVDQKYLAPLELFDRVVAGMGEGYEVLEIDGLRSFAYESVYFDTSDLLCFRQHVYNERPRFKVRTRHYTETGACVFEVKVKAGDGKMLKRHLERDPDQHGQMDDEAARFVDETLEEWGLDPVSSRLEPSLVTRFDRTTFAARDGAERVTCDRHVAMEEPGGRAVRLQADHLLIETKTEGGEGPWNAAFSGEGLAPVSLSKYRVGQSLLGAEDTEDPLDRHARALFDTAVAR